MIYVSLGKILQIGILSGLDIVSNVWEIKVVEHSDPLFLKKADFLCVASGG